MCAALAGANLRSKGSKVNKIAPLEPKYGHGASFLQSKFDSWNNVLVGVNNKLLSTQTENEISPDEDKSQKSQRVTKIQILVRFFSRLVAKFLLFSQS